MIRHRLKYLFCSAFVMIGLLASAQKPANPLPGTKAKIQHRFSTPASAHADTLWMNPTGSAAPPIKAMPLKALPKAPLSHIRSSKELGGGLTLDINFTGTTCGASNGTISATVFGGTGPYQFALNADPYQHIGAFAGLTAGTYTISVKDAGGQTGSASCTLTNMYAMPNLQVSSSINATDCANFDGSVTLSAGGGTPPYTFSDDEINYQPGNVFDALSSGSYTFLARDAHGCFAPATTNLFLDCPANFNFGGYVGGYACVDNGSLNIVQVANGTPPYSFSLDGVHYQPTGKFDGLTPGRYHLYIRDATGRIMVYSFPVHPFCAIVVAAITTDADCSTPNGSISITASRGEGPYLYSLDGVNFQADPVFNGLAPGVYTAWVKDANGFTGTLPEVMVETLCPIVTVETTPALCGQNNGTITATGSDGLPPYSFSKDGTNFQKQNTFNALAPGQYNITIRDAAGLKGTVMAIVGQACITVSGSVTNAHCGSNNGSILVSVSDGIAPYSYSLDGISFQANNLFENLGAGHFTVWAKDGQGAQNSSTILVTNTVSPDISVGTVNSGCDNNGSITIMGSGGTGSLEYGLNTGAFQSGNQFTGLAAGDYLASVRDNLGCSTNQPVHLSLNNNLTVDAGKDTTVCEASPFSLNGSTNASTFSWTPSTGLEDASLLHTQGKASTSTDFTLQVSQGLCTASATVRVLVNPAPKPDAGVDSFVCVGKSTSLHGNGGLSYQWHPADFLSDPDIADPLVIRPGRTITYFLKVTDADHCSSVQDDGVTIQVISTGLFAGHDTAIARNEPLQLNAIDTENSGFTEYQWSPVTGLNDPDIADPIARISQDMTYHVKALTAGGCAGETSISIKLYTGPEIYVPNVFSPNHDGHNDILKPFPVGISVFRYFAVYNRWGQRVFYSENAASGWDGSWRGSPQENGGFVWMAGGIDYQGHLLSRRGTVMLIR